MKNSKKSFIFSILSVLICISMLIGTTFAWFTDTVTTGKNKIIAGTLDLEIYHTNSEVENESIEDEDSALWSKYEDGNDILWEPGVVCYETFTAKNKGTLALTYKMVINQLADADYNTVVSNDSSNGMSLKDVLYVHTVTGLAETTRPATKMDEEDKTIAQLLSEDAELLSGNLEAGASSSEITVYIYWPTDSGNECNIQNGKSTSDGEPLYIDLSVTATATQYTFESDSYDNQYDKAASDDSDDETVANYLTFTANTAGSSVTPKFISGSYKYSTDDGESWTDGAIDGTTTITLTNEGDKVMLKGTNCTTGYYSNLMQAYDPDSSLSFIMTGSIAASGDITSLTNGVGGDVALEAGCYCSMFKGCTALTSAPNLPSTTVAQKCYSYMFSGCTALASAPTLPAETLAKLCYQCMFSGCTALTSAPELPATTLAYACYDNMFSSCTKLTTAPALNATNLEAFCYTCMFSGCTALIAAPNLPAETLANNCYQAMFKDCAALATAPTISATTLAQSCCNVMFANCTSLEVAPELNATNLADSCYYEMFFGCTKLTTAPNLPATILAEYCYSGIFNSCTALVNAPTISATTLASNCCNLMFSGCTSLETAPVLNATKLASNCYANMFYGCTKLATAPTLSSTELAYCCYDKMFFGCTSLTTAPALPATTLASYCYKQMFDGCTSLTTAPNLPATSLADECYYMMFNDCTSLKISEGEPTTYSKKGVIFTCTTTTSKTQLMFKNTAGTFYTEGNEGSPGYYTYYWYIE